MALPISRTRDPAFDRLRRCGGRTPRSSCCHGACARTRSARDGRAPDAGDADCITPRSHRGRRGAPRSEPPGTSGRGYALARREGALRHRVVVAAADAFHRPPIVHFVAARAERDRGALLGFEEPTQRFPLRASEEDRRGHRLGSSRRGSLEAGVESRCERIDGVASVPARGGGWDARAPPSGAGRSAAGVGGETRGIAELAREVAKE